MKLISAVEIWVTTRSDAQQITDQTGRDYLRNLTRFANDVGPERDVSEITAEDFQLWLSRVRRQDGSRYEPASLNTLAAGVRSFFSDMYLDAHIERDPTRRVRRAKTRRRLPRAASVEDVVQFLRHADARERLMILLMVHAGARRFEVAKFQIEDWDRERQQIRIEDGKGGKDDVLPVGDELAQAIELHLASLPRTHLAGAVFPSPKRHGQPIGRSTINRIFQNLSARAGVKITPHMLRHTMATTALEDGVPANVVQHLMRHEDLRTLSEYSRLVPDELAGFVGTRRYQPRLEAVPDAG